MYVGYWVNKKTGKTSSSTPIQADGVYIGNNQGSPGWRRGGTPRKPTQLEWLLSKRGGIKP